MDELITLLKKNKISEARDKLYISLYTNNNQNLLEPLGIVECILGNFQTAYSIFSYLNSISPRDEITNYLDFLKSDIKDTYIPKFNEFISKINSDNNDREIEQLFDELQNISKNVELYELGALYYLKIKNFKKAKKLISIGKSLDESNRLFNNLERIIFFKKTKNYYLMTASLALILTTFSAMKIYKYNNRKNIPVVSKLEIKVPQNSSSVVVEEVPIEKSNNFFYSETEKYSIAIKRYKNKNYPDSIKILEDIKNSDFAKYIKKEIIFLLAQSYEKIGNYEKAINYYNEFILKYNDKEFEFYYNISKEKINKLKNLK